MKQEIEFSPNYDKECQQCGQTPIVQVIDCENQELIEDSELCGVCFFGEVTYIEVENW